MELFRQFAVVKSIFVVRDLNSGISRGVAFVEFHTIDHAAYVLQSSEASKLQMDSSSTPLKLCYAKQSFMANQISQVINTLL
jgi:RNA recognition motif-containing protein